MSSKSKQRHIATCETLQREQIIRHTTMPPGRNNDPPFHGARGQQWHLVFRAQKGPHWREKLMVSVPGCCHGDLWYHNLTHGLDPLSLYLQHTVEAVLCYFLYPELVLSVVTLNHLLFGFPSQWTNLTPLRWREFIFITCIYNEHILIEEGRGEQVY